MTLQLQAKPQAKAQRTNPPSTLYLLDGHSLTFRAYYAIGANLTAPDGSPVGAVYGFLRMLLKILEEHQPEYFAIVFDTPGPTFRSKIYPEYKANREAPPPDFSDQMEKIYEMLGRMGIPIFQKEGYEADDILATFASELTDAGGRSIVITADKDLLQLVDDKTQVLRLGSFKATDMKLYDAEAVEERMGVRPEQVADWLALVGDASDNIPGVPSIGEKSATKLLKEYATLDEILDRVDEIANKRQQNALRENGELARMSLRLATVERRVPIEWSYEDCKVPDNLWGKECVEFISSLGFDSILRERGIEASPSASRAESGEYRIVYASEDLKAWVEKARKAPWVALDTETTGLDPLHAELVGLCLASEPGEAIYVPLTHRVGSEVDAQMSLGDAKKVLEPIFSAAFDKTPRLSGHHAKYDWHILKGAGFEVRPPEFDTMIASFVLDPGRSGGHGLKSLAQILLGMTMAPISDIIGSGKSAVTTDLVPPEDFYVYAAKDADATLRLTERLSAELESDAELKALFEEIELPLIPVLQRMERGGFAVDTGRLGELGETMGREVHRLAREVWKEAGREFNIDSPKQVSALLFDELGLPPGKKTKTGFSTDNSVLESLRPSYPIAGLILEYRGVKKLKSTYADALPSAINPATGRIHTSLNQTIAQTGRLSSNNPNLQNIPIRSELGREIRRTFVPDAPDHKLLSADYSQIELRILAHVSGDEALRDAYQTGRDIHALTASQVFDVDRAEVTSDMRAQAKIINFGIVYGMSAHGLSQRLRIPRAQAADFIKAYFGTYPGVKAWIDRTLEQARKDGFVRTLRGRKRWLPDINAKNSMVRANAERIAVNSPIQGTSADMIKLAMIAIDRGLASAVPGARMVLQVHDELIFSAPESQLDALAEYVEREMREALPLDVPIVVGVAVGDNWGDCK